MKKILIALVISMAVASCSKAPLPANNTTTENRITTPPAAVQTAFTANFGTVSVSEWKLRSDGTYKAHFTNNGKAWEATFDSAGTLIKSEAA